MAPDSGLRTVNTSELLQADRKLWGELAAMHSEGWSLDEALREMTKVRSDMHALLQPGAKQLIVYKGKRVFQSQLKDSPTARSNEAGQQDSVPQI